jgi:hypothetical protein
MFSRCAIGRAGSPLPAWKDKKGFMEDALQTVHEKFYNDAWDVTPIREMCAKSYHGHMDGIQVRYPLVLQLGAAWLT